MGPPTSNQSPGIKVLSLLHVDDNEQDRFLLAYSVEKLPIKLTGTASGAEALKILEVLQPDIIILDIRMPGMSGFEVLEQIKSSNRFSSIPVVMFSNSSYAQDVRQARALGAESYYVKPTGISEYRQLFLGLYHAWLKSEAPNHWPPDISMG